MQMGDQKLFSKETVNTQHVLCDETFINTFLPFVLLCVIRNKNPDFQEAQICSSDKIAFSL